MDVIRSKAVRRVLRVLITILGAGVGAALAALALKLAAWRGMNAGRALTIALYAGVSAVGGVVFFALSHAIMEKLMSLSAAVERRWEKMPMHQIITSAGGLIVGLVIAALLTQLILTLGSSIITVCFSAIVYVMLGWMGMSIGFRRSREIPIAAPDAAKQIAADAQADAAQIPAKLLDTSVIIDGRVLDVARTGFLEGEMIIPQFVLAELQHIADSSDALRRNRGRRGLDVLAKMQKELKRGVRVLDTDYDDVDEVDVKLLRLARETGGIVVTNDYNLNKVANVTGVRVLNLNELANAVKPVLLPGEEMTVQIVREGKEPGQGVGYLDDGTMIVVDNGRRSVGQTVTVQVTTVLQTSAGRMIFTRLKPPDEAGREVRAG